MADQKETSTAKAKPDKKNWYSDRYQFVVVQRNMLALITLLSLLCSIAATFSISQLAPLKAVDPFVIQVDQKSGVTQVVNPLKSRDLTANEAVNHYFIIQYIRARESYVDSPEHNYFNYNEVRALTDPSIFTTYKRSMALSNPTSFAARLGVGGSRDVHFNSIQFLDKQDLRYGEESRRYQVKVQITEKEAGHPPRVMQRVILIEYKYTELDLTTEDRYLNPLGFLVLSYRVDEDNETHNETQ